MTPSEDTATIHGLKDQEPTRIRNSPTKPLKPGTAIEDRLISRNTAKYQGMTALSPPNSAICRVCRRS